MPITITGQGTATTPVHRDGALPATTLVPSRRETIEALGYVERMLANGHTTLLVDEEVISASTACDILRRFILTR